MDSVRDLIRLSEVLYERGRKLGRHGLTPPERVFLTVWGLEAEVNNGGFHQYYFNSTGDHATEAPAALRTIGAPHMADITSRANRLFGPVGPSADRFERRSQLMQLPGEGLGLFGSLDQEFYKYPDDLAGLLKAYVAVNRSSFPPLK